MCGIFGTYSAAEPMTRTQIAAILVKGLSLLEYRGYDSAGIGISDKNGETFICKSEGNVKKLSDKVDEAIKYESYECQSQMVIGIAHTRWATHGPPSDVNSHPHVSDDTNTFVVVHNGIITNFKQLKHMLQTKGHQFLSQTDTELIPKLCKLEYDQVRTETPKFKDIVMNVIKQLEGTFALLITSKQFPNELIVCRKGSPLVIGRNANGAYGLSSDMSALVNSQDIMFLDDNQLAHFTSSTPSNITLYNTLTNQIIEEHKWTHNKVELESVSKGQFDSFMEKEIFEQPISLYRTIHDNTYLDARKRIGFKNNELSNYQHAIHKAQNIVLVACGTSYHSCVASRLILSKFTNKNVYVEVAGQFAEVEPLLNNNCIYMFVSQSGETADTLEALRYVQRNSSAVCVGITNKPESAIARECHCSIDLNAGLEISVASTKAYTSQMSMFLLIAMAIRNDISTNVMDDMLEYQLAVIRIPDVVKSSLLGTNDRIKDVAIQMQDFKSMFFIGRGNDYATALEAALKVKEIAYIHAEGLMASELKHGPLAMIDDNVCLIVFATQNKHYQKQISVIEQLKARKGKLYIVCNDNDDTMSSIIDEKYLIRVPNNHELTHHIANIIPMQLLAYHLAVKKGYSVDQPRNLAKSVTVSD